MFKFLHVAPKRSFKNVQLPLPCALMHPHTITYAGADGPSPL